MSDKSVPLYNRLAGMFACAAFLMVGLGGFFATENPGQSLMYGIIAALVAGVIGQRIGYILAFPANKNALKNRAKNKKKRSPQMLSNPTERYTPLTGEETFLDDLDG